MQCFTYAEHPALQLFAALIGVYLVAGQQACESINGLSGIIIDRYCKNKGMVRLPRVLVVAPSPANSLETFCSQSNLRPIRSSLELASSPQLLEWQVLLHPSSRAAQILSSLGSQGSTLGGQRELGLNHLGDCQPPKQRDPWRVWTLSTLCPNVMNALSKELTQVWCTDGFAGKRR